MRSAGSEAAARGSVAGVVLAGGRSRRFGRDKLAEFYGGRPLLQHPVSRLLEVCDRVVVVLAADAADPPMPPETPVEFARDAIEGEGPL
ncbi:MAG: NTP transferase domain-containing protein, partial [Actinomycetota bacterium]|nr:NTP transferase domain-containing protein [Actinomycetota bacterium]